MSDRLRQFEKIKMELAQAQSDIQELQEQMQLLKNHWHSYYTFEDLGTTSEAEYSVDRKELD